MSRGIVNHRPYSHKKRRQSFKKKLNRYGISIPEINISPKIKNIISWTLVFVLVIVCGVIFLIRALFFGKNQTITQVKFSEGTKMTFTDPYLFGFIADEVIGKNYYAIRHNKNQLLTEIQNGFNVKSLSGKNTEFKFPFVGDINFQLEAPEQNVAEQEKTDIIIGIIFPLELPILEYQMTTTAFPLRLGQPEADDGGILGVELLYYDPKLLIRLNGKDFAVRDENTYIELKEGMLLGIRIPTEEDPNPEQLFTIETPQYLSGTTSLDGFFFDISLSDFIQIISLAKDSFPTMKRFVYLVGSTRVAIFTPDEKTLYFNFPKGADIQKQWDTQIQKYNLIKEKYTNFHNVWTIDLGSLEDNKAIIKKY